MAGDLKLFAQDPASGVLIFGISDPPQTVSGIDKLVQIVALALLNNGGRSITNPGRAGGLRRLIGGNINLDDPSELFADIRIMTGRVEQTIKEEQLRITRPTSERLLSLQLIDIVPNELELAIEVIVGVVNEDRVLAQATVLAQ